MTRLDGDYCEKLITKAMFEKFKRSKDGVLYLPTADYTAIDSFPEKCAFGEMCNFGEGCIFGGWCNFGGGCSFGKLCNFGKRCFFGELCRFGETCSFGEMCFFGEGCIAIKPFWSFVYEPPFKTEGKILPTLYCREYWEERLNMKLNGCYEGIEKILTPKKIDKILKRKDLTKCERRILESWR